MPDFIGTEFADILEGTRGADRIRGFGGNDLLLGGLGPDLLDGGLGNDTLVGGTGDDRLIGGAGFDTVQVNGPQAAATWRVGNGLAFDNPGLFIFDNDETSFPAASFREVEQLEFNGQAGSDRLIVEDVFGTRLVAIPGGSTEVVGIKNLTFSGGGGNDTLEGGAANGPLIGRGGAGDDLLIGGSGNDTLVGGLGNDVLIGGLGSDVLKGSAGADVFRFLAANDSSPATQRSAPDAIRDFSRADGDRIDLSGIDADVTEPGNQAFLFANGLQFVRYQPGLLTTAIDQARGETSISLDTGAGATTLLAVAAGRIEFTAADFIL